MKQGGFDYLIKPCDIEHLLARVTEAAARKRQHEENFIQAPHQGYHLPVYLKNPDLNGPAFLFIFEPSHFPFGLKLYS
jgi:hypothetical protein